MPRDRWGDIYANTPMKKMIALYDYDPMELSPNVDSEVTFLFALCNWTPVPIDVFPRSSFPLGLVTSSLCTGRWMMTASTWQS